MIALEFVNASITCLCGEAGFDQRVITTEHRGRIVNSFFFEYPHRTGAGMFRRSRTVSDNHLIAGQLLPPLADFAEGNRQRAFDMAYLVGFYAAHINQHRFILFQ